jgi:hypothetical protein
LPYILIEEVSIAGEWINDLSVLKSIAKLK